MEEIGRELCGLGRNPSSALVSTFGDALVVVAMHDVAAVDEVVDADGIFCPHFVMIFGLNTVHINTFFDTFWHLLYHATHHSSRRYE